MGMSLGLGIGFTFSAGGGVPALQPLNAMEASQAPIAIYSLRKVNPAYAGNCLQVRDSGNTLRTIGFNAQGYIDVATLITYGDGVTFTVATLYDQSGNGRNLTTTIRPPLVLGMITTADGFSLPGIDFQSKNQNMVSGTGTEFLNVGGTANLSILAIAGTFGWSSAGTHARNPAVYSAGVNGPLLGYGTVSGNRLAYGALGASGETVMYDGEGELFVDASTPDNTRIRNIWFNQTGANVSGGADVRKLFTNRPHGKAASGASRLVLGNRGDLLQSHNGPVFEVILYNAAGALSDTECQRIALWQREYWGALGAARYPDRYLSIFSGQSNAQYYYVDASSGDGSAGSNAGTRVYKPALETLLGFPTTTKSIIYYGNNTAFGNSAVVKAVLDGGDTNYWWDADTAGAGPNLTQWASQVAGTPGKKYRKTVIMWAQGEREALEMSEGASDVSAAWKAQTKLVWAYMRSIIGYDCPIVIQPLGNQTGSQAQMEALRAVQTELAAEVANVFLSAETTDLERQDSVHFAKIPNVNGYDLGASRLATAIGARMNAMVAL